MGEWDPARSRSLLILIHGGVAARMNLSREPASSKKAAGLSGGLEPMFESISLSFRLMEAAHLLGHLRFALYAVSVGSEQQAIGNKGF